MEEKLQYHVISIKDKDLMKRYTDVWNLESSGYSFTTAFIWGSDGAVRIAEQDDVLYLCGHYAQPMLFAPLSLRPEVYGEAIRVAAADWEQGGREAVFYGVTDELAPYFEAAGYTLTADRNNADYVYSAQSLITLKGKAYHGKRNHINRFLESYTFAYEPLTPDMMDACMTVYDEWMAEKAEEFAAERRATVHALSHMDELGLKGGVIRVDGALTAFTIGERLRPDMALIHIEKAVDIPGMFPLINREFLAHEFADVQYVNREEDMGLPGLRRAKESYAPVRMINKYIARR
ncbi:MAG: phosphatidylglycerol lysyltransferase domain-containing protein [Clostridia bacterium]|nr:phosphatidylglycerol lysyltransferase domain-containing protein [Clostridia bacterium]